MRPIAPVAPATWPTSGRPGHSLELPLRSLTPIYKGGARPDRVDPDRPFRVSSIRGMLRYWWRATSPITDVDALRQAERTLFGGVFGQRACASHVTLSCTTMNSRLAPAINDAAYAYVFGVTGAPNGQKVLHLDARGRLRIEWTTDAQADVDRALRAWLLFGGIGGRSRRGCGSVWWDEPGASAPDTVEAYVAGARALTPAGGGQPRWPTLRGGAVLVGPSYNSSDEAWRAGLEGMKQVRASQGVDPAVAARLGRPSLTNWKQQDYLRVVNAGHFSSPRAALGLPIRFLGTAQSFTMSPVGENRFPSPIHLKVIRLKQNFRPVYAIVRTPMPHQLRAGAQQGQLDPAGLDLFIQYAARLPGWTHHVL